MRALILPNSNSDVERIFSAMIYVKSKFRNGVKTDLLNAILVVECEYIKKEKCCMSYKLHDSVVRFIETTQANKSSTQTSCSSVE